MLNYKMPKLNDLINKETVNLEEVSSNDIAIIGMSIKLSKADNIDDFWNIILNKVNCVGSFPKGRKEDCERYLNNYKLSNVGNVRLES